MRCRLLQPPPRVVVDNGFLVERDVNVDVGINVWPYAFDSDRSPSRRRGQHRARDRHRDDVRDGVRDRQTPS